MAERGSCTRSALGGLMLDWQTIIAAVVVAGAAGGLCGRAFRMARSQNASCHGCRGCSSDKNPPLVTLQKNPMSKSTKNVDSSSSEA